MDETRNPEGIGDPGPKPGVPPQPEPEPGLTAQPEATPVSESAAHPTYQLPDDVADAGIGAGAAADSPPAVTPNVPGEATASHEHPHQHHPPAPVEPASREPLRIGCIAALVALIIGTFAGLAGGLAGARFVEMGGLPEPEPPTLAVIEGETEEIVAAVAAKTVSTVVNIDIQATRGARELDDEEELPEGHPGVPVIGNGSGVAYMEDGDGGTYVLTNDHVVEGATRIVVTDSQGERYEGELIGSDPNTDIAVVRIDGRLPTAEIGDSDELTLGQMVVAIGSPFGLQQSVTAGVVSAIGRSLPGTTSQENTYPLVDVIQTDAAINPGNSGGALLDREGRLVGINTAIFSDTGANAGIAFAVPVNTAIRVAGEIIETGKAQLPFLGVVGTDVTEILAEQEDLPADEGALIIEVSEGTEAEKAGIQADDIIVGYEGRSVRSMDDLLLVVRQSAVGDVVVLELWRDGELIEVEMTVGAKPDDL